MAAGAMLFAAVVIVLPPSRARTLVALLLPFAILLGVSVWWFRRGSPTRRAKTLGAGMALFAALCLALVPSFPANLIAFLWGLPVSMGLALVVLSLWPGRAASGRLTAVGAAFLVSLVPWMFLRADGASGQMMPNLVWVWDAPASVDSPELDTSTPLADTTELVATELDWPGFRGDSRDGVVVAEAASGLDLEWGVRPPSESWRRAIGPGWSSFAVVGDLACTQDQAGEMERVVCLDARTGLSLWTHAERTRFEETASGPGPRATPSIVDGRLYSLGASGRLLCLDARTGRKLWEADLSGGEGVAPEWGFASSPLIRGGRVYVSPAGVGGIRMLALDSRTGERLWQAGGEHSGYGSAQLAALDGTPQLLLFDGGGLVSYEPATGEELWHYEWPAELPRATQPLVLGSDTVLIGMGYSRGTKSLRLSRSDGGWVVVEQWSTNRFKPKFNDFVLRADHVYGLDEGILVCLDALTGERLWKGGRYGYGQLLLVGDVLLIVTESGELVLVQASPAEHNELGRIPALSGKSWAHPALAGGRLFVRNGSEAVAFDLR